MSRKMAQREFQVFASEFCRRCWFSWFAFTCCETKNRDNFPVLQKYISDEQNLKVSVFSLLIKFRKEPLHLVLGVQPKDLASNFL